ncbi:MAG: hypothetical protein ACKOW3_03540 [Hyphomicrobium sp.]
MESDYDLLNRIRSPFHAASSKWRKPELTIKLHHSMGAGQSANMFLGNFAAITFVYVLLNLAIGVYVTAMKLYNKQE